MRTRIERKTDPVKKDDQNHNYFDLKGLKVAITGGAGILCSGISQALLDAGAEVAILDLDVNNARNLFAEEASNERLMIEYCDVLDKEKVETAMTNVTNRFGRIDVLINGAGGNHPQATTDQLRPFFDISTESMKFVFNLNMLGTIIPSQVAGKHMAEEGTGSILNISSMCADRPLTRVLAYSAAKAGVSNFTKWLAVHMAQEYSPLIRVNAISPGFFLTEQNRFLLTNPASGNLTERGQAILDHTPMRRFGNPDDLIGAVMWLLSPSASFVSGVVLPIDGGFSAFSGV